MTYCWWTSSLQHLQYAYWLALEASSSIRDIAILERYMEAQIIIGLHAVTNTVRLYHAH